MIVVRDRVRYYETDLMGVVHHTNYLRFFEMGRVEYLHRAGVSLMDLQADGIVTPITKVDAQYKHPLRFDDEFEIRVHMVTFTRVKMDFTFEVVNVATGDVCVTGATQNLFSTPEGKLVRLPAKWYEPIKSLVEKELQHDGL